MKKWICLVALLAMGSLTAQAQIVDGDFSGAGFVARADALNSSHLNNGWYVGYDGDPTAWHYDTANNEVTRGTTASSRPFSQVFSSPLTGPQTIKIQWAMIDGDDSSDNRISYAVYGINNGTGSGLASFENTSWSFTTTAASGSTVTKLAEARRINMTGSAKTDDIDIPVDFGTGYDAYVIGFSSFNMNAGDSLTVTDINILLTTGPALISYAGPANEPVEPGIPQDVRVIVQNNGLEVSNVVATLSPKNSALFTVHDGPFSNALLAIGASVTNTFSVTATNTITAGITSAFDLNVYGEATDGSSTNLQEDVSVEILDTAFSSIDKTALISAPGGTDTAQITVSNTATFALQFRLSSTQAWLTHPTGTLTLPTNSVTNITVTADATVAGGDGHYEDTLSVTYLNNGSTPTNFLIKFDVGSKITPLVPPVFTPGVGGLIPGEYEPGETFTVTITSTNDGSSDVSNIVNTLTLPAGWGTPSPTSETYAFMATGDSTSSTYTVTIPAGTVAGTYTSTVQNEADGSRWPVEFDLVTVYNQAVPSVTTNAVTIYVPVGGTASESITLTNAGNAPIGFTLSDNGSWPFSYLVSTQTASLVTFYPVYDTPDPNTTFIDWEGTDTNLTAETTIGFIFPFYGKPHSTFQVNSYGNLLFNIATTNFLMPYWGNTMSDTNSVRYKKEADRLVVAWNNRADQPEFQVWIHTDGSIRYVYDGTLPDHDERWIGLTKDGDYDLISYTPGAHESLLLTPSPEAWVTYAPSPGSVDGQDVQDITYTADAKDQTNGTIYVFTNTVTWGDSSTEDVVVTVQVGGDAHAGMSVADVSFSGPAGFISTNSMMLVNTGDVALVYTFTDTGARDEGYTWERTPFNWDDSNWDTHSGQFVPTDINEGVSDFIAIGFDFHYYGNVYTQISIGVNGAISLGEEGRLMTSTYLEDVEPKHGTGNREWVKRTNTLSTIWPKTDWIETTDVPSTPAPEFLDIPDQLIAACWQDFTYDGNAIIRYSGNANQLVISWENMAQTFAGVDQAFQMILNRDGTITFQYKYLDGSDVWPGAIVGLRDSGGDWTTSAHLLFPDQESIPGTVTVTTNYNTTTNWMKWDGSITNWAHPDYDTEIITIIGTNVVTTPHETVEEQAIMFYPSERVVITVNPTYGTLPFGETNFHTVYGDARSLAAPGGETVPVNTTFDIDYGFGTEAVSVLFIATNSADAGYSPLSTDSDGDGMSDVGELMFGSDGVVSVEQNPDGSRTLSWPEPDFSADRNFIVWYTTDLTSGWNELVQLGNTTSYTDTEHADEPVIYYKVTVE